MRQVEVGGRLIEQQDVGFLGERHGNPDALALTAGEFGDLSFCEGHGIGGFESPSNRLVVFGAVPLEEALVGVASSGDQVGYGDAFGGGGVLRHEPDHAGEALHGVFVGGLTVEGEVAVERLEQSGDTA